MEQLDASALKAEIASFRTCRSTTENPLIHYSQVRVGTVTSTCQFLRPTNKAALFNLMYSEIDVSSEYEIAYCPNGKLSLESVQPGVIISVRYLGRIRGLWHSSSKETWKHSVGVDIHHQSGRLSFKISDENIQFCGGISQELIETSFIQMVDWMNKLIAEHNYILDNPSTVANYVSQLIDSNIFLTSHEMKNQWLETTPIEFRLLLQGIAYGWINTSDIAAELIDVLDQVLGYGRLEPVVIESYDYDMWKNSYIIPSHYTSEQIYQKFLTVPILRMAIYYPEISNIIKVKIPEVDDSNPDDVFDRLHTITIQRTMWIDHTGYGGPYMEGVHNIILNVISEI